LICWTISGVNVVAQPSNAITINRIDIIFIIVASIHEYKHSNTNKVHSSCIENRKYLKKKTIIAIAICWTILLMISCEKKQYVIVKEGGAAPAFALKGLDGKTVSLSDFRGKVVVLDFWATWCHSCKETSQELQLLHEKADDSRVVVLGVSMDIGGSAVQQVKDFMAEYKLSYPMLMGNDAVKKSYAVTRIPVTYLLNKDHIIIKTYVGAVPEMGEKISEQIKKLL
jgi:peroxiredoxin